jgi:hypothetical protein
MIFFQRYRSCDSEFWRGGYCLNHFSVKVRNDRIGK